MTIKSPYMNGTIFDETGLKKQTDLFRDDLGDPQAPLAMLVTYCHFCAIYHRSPVGLPVPSTLSSLPEAKSMNLLLQQIAWDTVSNDPMSSVKRKAVANVSVLK